MISEKWKSGTTKVARSELMEGLEEVLSGLLEPLVGLVIQRAFVFDEGRRDVTPSGISGEEDDDIAIAVLPAVLDDVVLTDRFDSLNLDPVIIRTVGNEDVGLVPVIEDGCKYLPAIFH